MENEPCRSEEKQSSGELRPFDATDFAEYSTWYADSELNRQLGPMDEEWLSEVLADEEATQFSYFEYDRLSAVIGITFHPVEQAWVVTDLAVNPSSKRRGIGARTVRAMMEADGRRRGENWMAYVAADNAPAQNFFLALGWRCSATPTVDDDTFTFRL